MSEFPKDDCEFSDVKITEVEKGDEGWFVTRDDGWSNYVPGDSPIEPAVGMVLRVYGKGTRFRGLFLDGCKVFYRTETEDNEHHEIQMYGADAADWLARWDANKGVWSIEMGGLGPGYEQCIQITAAEVLRLILANKYDAAKWMDDETWKRDLDEIEKAVQPRLKPLGLSGAQWGAAVSLATKLYKQGPREIMNDPELKERHIQVQRSFPSIAA